MGCVEMDPVVVPMDIFNETFRWNPYGLRREEATQRWIHFCEDPTWNTWIEATEGLIGVERLTGEASRAIYEEDSYRAAALLAEALGAPTETEALESTRLAKSVQRILLLVAGPILLFIAATAWRLLCLAWGWNQ